MLMKRIAWSVFLTLAVGFFSAKPAMAQSKSLAHIGVRVGVSGDPDQIYIGAHMDLAEIAPKFWFRPNVEVGGGDGGVVIGLNGEFVYLIPLQSKPWNIYVGGGPAVVVRGFNAGPNNRVWDTGPGFNFLMGIQQPKGLLAEIKLGALDSPDFKFGIGWTW